METTDILTKMMIHRHTHRRTRLILVLDVWESMIPFYEIGGIVRGMGKGTGRGIGRGMGQFCTRSHLL